MKTQPIVVHGEARRYPETIGPSLKVLVKNPDPGTAHTVAAAAGASDCTRVILEPPAG